MFRFCMLVFFIAGIVFAVSPALAADAVPNIPLVAAQDAVSGLYAFSLKVVGLAVFVMFLIAGLTYILPGMESKFGKPIEIIKNAVIGLILLFSAVLILNTINPDFTGGPAQPRQPSQQSQPLTQP